MGVLMELPFNVFSTCINFSFISLMLQPCLLHLIYVFMSSFSVLPCDKRFQMKLTPITSHFITHLYSLIQSNTVALS